MPGAGLPGLRGQRLPRQPYPRPGVVEANAKLIQAQVLVPFLARKGVVVVRVRPVALSGEQLAVSIIPVVVGALALVLGNANRAAAAVVTASVAWPGVPSGSESINPVDKS